MSEQVRGEGWAGYDETLARLDAEGRSEPSYGCGECPAACGYACWLRRARATDTATEEAMTEPITETVPAPHVGMTHVAWQEVQTAAIKRLVAKVEEAGHDPGPGAVVCVMRAESVIFTWTPRGPSWPAPGSVRGEREL